MGRSRLKVLLVEYSVTISEVNRYVCLGLSFTHTCTIDYLGKCKIVFSVRMIKNWSQLPVG